MRFHAFAASAFALTALLAGCGAGDDSGSAAPQTGSNPAEIMESTPVATLPDAAPAIVTVYFLRDDKVGASRRAVVAGPQVGRAAMIELLEGPGRAETSAGLRTAIPAGTELEALSIADGLATVELSQELQPEAVAQVVYTLTQFPTVKRVDFDGMASSGPAGRADLEDFTPSVLVESPTLGEDVSSPLRIKGTADTFEATFNVEVVDANGKVLGKRFVTATSGTGMRGTFDAEVPFGAASGQVDLVVYETSAEDDSRIHEVKIPLQIALH